jgi:myo-inositol-1(or 4)-monophosphatase
VEKRSVELETMIAAAESAGAGLRQDFERLDLVLVREKAASDFVSSADLRSQATLRETLSAAFPSYGFLLEEGDDRDGKDARFIADPLDGTTNFLHGIPHYAIAIAFELKGEVVAGVVLDVPKGELFWAEKGRGAWLGERRLVASRETDLARAIVATGVPHRGRGDHPRYLGALGNVMRDVAGIRRMGAAALDLAYVAAGRCEAFFEQGLSPWDVAAGGLLVREAGGIMTQTDGAIVSLSGDVLASGSDSVHAAMLAALAPLHLASADRK